MILATEAGCDLLNLSLVNDDADDVVSEGLQDAARQGAVVFAAAGNDGRAGLGFPARSPDAIGISAFGASGCLPTGGVPQDVEIGTPSPSSANDFFAAFSNYGPGVRFIAPGVGVISTAPNGGYGVRSGTSMACAAATGLAARLLSKNLPALNQTQGAARSAAIQNLLQAHATSLGFGFSYQGAGRL